MDSFIAVLKDKRRTVSLAGKAVIERHTNSINAISRFTARKDELKRLGYHIQHIGVETIQSRRIEKSKPVQRQRKIRCLSDI